jgi:hypothetical protein
MNLLKSPKEFSLSPHTTDKSQSNHTDKTQLSDNTISDNNDRNNQQEKFGNLTISQSNSLKDFLKSVPSNKRNSAINTIRNYINI